MPMDGLHNVEPYVRCKRSDAVSMIRYYSPYIYDIHNPYAPRMESYIYIYMLYIYIYVYIYTHPHLGHFGNVNI